MEKTDSMPIWVYLAFSSIGTRKAALFVIWACAIFSVYCVPWSQLSASPEWFNSIFLIEDWSWFAMMVPMTVWYWMSLRWVDRNFGWGDTSQVKG